MAELSPAEFEARWQSASKGPTFRQAETQPVQIDFSLSALLDQYVAMVDGLVTRGTVSRIDHDALIAAVSALKVVLDRINDKDLVAQAVADRSKAFQQQMRERLANFAIAASGR
jgi:hypothetical protein